MNYGLKFSAIDSHADHFLQNENDRLRSQLAQLRNQQTRDTEKHQLVLSNLNEQLKG